MSGFGNNRLTALAALLSLGVIGLAAAALGAWSVALSAVVLLHVLVGGIVLHLHHRAFLLAGSLSRVERRTDTTREDVRALHRELPSVAEQRSMCRDGELQMRQLQDVLEGSLSTIVGTSQQVDVRLRDLERSLAESGGPGAVDRRHAELRVLRSDVVREVDALFQLHRRFPLRGEAPLTYGWALSPSRLLAVLAEAAHSSGTILECGSGTSTIFLAEALRLEGSGRRVIALEHIPDIANAVRADLERQGLSHVADVRDAPLVPVTTTAGTVDWYDPAALQGVTDVGLFLVDGPPKRTGPLARYPAVPIAGPCLREDARIVLDDADRPDERAILQRWQEEFGLHAEHPSKELARLLWAARTR